MLTRPAAPRLLLAVIALAIGLLAPSAVAHAGAVRTDAAGCTTNTLPANDDGSTSAVALPFTINFFDNEYTQVFVNNNGNVTFDQALGEFTPFDFTVSGTPMIAPFLADVDTQGAGSSQVTYGTTTVGTNQAFCVNWVDVGYYNDHTDKLLSAQLLLIQGTDGDFDIEFNYDKVQWETGDASGGSGGFGGTPAAVGWANGDGDDGHSFMQPGSFSSGALVDANPTSGLIHGMKDSAGQVGRYVFAVRNGVSGPKLTGHVDDGNGNDVVSGPVEICPRTGGGACRIRNTNQTGNYRASGLPAGDYDLTANPPADGAGSDGTPAHDQVTMGSTDTAAPNLSLGPAPSPPPPGTTITSIDTSANGLPVAYWGDPLTLQTDACEGATVSYKISVEGQELRSGPMAEGPAGHYSATAAALEPNHGDGLVTIHVDCPVDPDPADIEFGVYIDPSGVVRDQAGAPVADATVTLLRSSNADGPFFPVPNGSAIMSPANRTNPDQTASDGRFGWDVVAGYYKVRASQFGCTDAETGVLTIPPPVTNLDLRLNCATDTGGGGNGGGGTGGGGVSNTAGAKIASVGKPSAKGSKVKVKVTCAKTATGNCAGSVAITTKVKGKKKSKKSAKPKTVTIGKASFKDIKAGKSKVVTVKLNKAGKKLAKKGKVKGKVTVKAHDSAGHPTTLIKNVTIPKAKKAHKKH